MQPNPESSKTHPVIYISHSLWVLYVLDAKTHYFVKQLLFQTQLFLKASVVHWSYWMIFSHILSTHPIDAKTLNVHSLE